MFAKIGRMVTVALAIVLLSSTLSLAADAKSTGTIVVVAEEVVTLKGADGKTYQVKVADVVAEDLKTGDMVEYEVIEGKPTKVKKKK